MTQPTRELTNQNEWHIVDRRVTLIVRHTEGPAVEHPLTPAEIRDRLEQLFDDHLDAGFVAYVDEISAETTLARTSG